MGRQAGRQADIPKQKKGRRWCKRIASRAAHLVTVEESLLLGHAQGLEAQDAVQLRVGAEAVAVRHHLRGEVQGLGRGRMCGC